MLLFQRELVCTLLGLSNMDVFYGNLKSKVSEKIGEDKLEAIENMGLLSEKLINKMDTPLDTLSCYLADKLALGKKSKDAINNYMRLMILPKNPLKLDIVHFSN